MDFLAIFNILTVNFLIFIENIEKKNFRKIGMFYRWYFFGEINLLFFFLKKTLLIKKKFKLKTLYGI